MLNFTLPTFVPHILPVAAPLALIVYYLAWKYLVGYLNRVLALG
jgi:hypothetical protein